MRNRVPVTIDGEDYTLVGEGDQQTIEKIAALVDERIRQVRQMPGISVKQAYVLAACDLAEEWLRASETGDHLRSQMKGYLDEAAQLRQELAQAQKELEQLRGRRG